MRQFRYSVVFLILSFNNDGDSIVLRIIKQLAEKLEAAGMPLEMISSEIIRELNNYDVSERYIRSCLDDKYKDAPKKRNKEIDVCGTHAADDGKKEIEVLSGGIEDVAVDGHTARC